MQLNQEYQQMLGVLNKDVSITGIILSGSWARGNNRPDSDIDLVIIKNNGGFKRRIEKINQQYFEIVENSPEGSIDFWKNNLDDSKRFWDIAIIVKDQAGFLEKSKIELQKIYEQGKKPLSNWQFEHLKFDYFDSTRSFRAKSQVSLEETKLLLYPKLLNALEAYFNIKGIWTPAPKQLLANIKKVDIELYNKVLAFYNTEELTEQIDIFESMLEYIFE